MDAKAHWESVYQTKRADRLSWFQPRAEISLDLIRRVAPDRTSRVIDVGGGASGTRRWAVGRRVQSNRRDGSVLRCIKGGTSPSWNCGRRCRVDRGRRSQHGITETRVRRLARPGRLSFLDGARRSNRLHRTGVPDGSATRPRARCDLCRGRTNEVQWTIGGPVLGRLAARRVRRCIPAR